MDTNPNTEVTPDDLMSALGEPEEAPQEVEQDSPAEEATGETSDEDSHAEQPTEDGLEEVELDGEMLKLPKKVADAVLRHKDYTQKTQEAADIRRRAEDRGQYLEAREHLIQATFNEAAELQAIAKQLEQYAGLDWNTLIAENPDQAMRLSMARQELKDKHAEKQAHVQRLIANAEAARTQHHQKQMELGRAELARRIGSITEADRQRTVKQGLSLGYSEQELATIADPRIMHALYKAAKWDALQEAKPKALQKVAQAPTAVKPAAPQRRTTNQAAAERLKQTGNPRDLMKFL